MKMWSQREISWKPIRVALALAGLFVAGAPLSASAQSVVYFRGAASSGWWSSGDGDENRWYRKSDGWDVRREDLADGQWSSSGTKAYVYVVFDNANQATMTVNALGGAQHSINTIMFSNSTSRSFTQDGGAFLSMGGGSGNAKIEADGSSGTGTYTFNTALRLEKTTELNPVGGTLTFNEPITNQGNSILVWGANGKTLNINGRLTGSGSLTVKQASFVSITNNNDFSGGLTVEKGAIRLASSTNAMGSGNISVGTNATLELNENVTWRPVQVTLYGTGTNGLGGLRKLTGSGDMAWPGAVVFGNTAAVDVGGGTLTMQGTASGSGLWTKLGSGGLILSGANTFSGDSIISNGVVRMLHGDALGTTAGSNIVVSGAALEITNAITSSERMSINGTGISSAGALNSLGGNNTLSGAIALGANSSVGVVADTLTMSGIISGSYSLTKVSAGTLTLSGNNTFSGGVTHNGSGGRINIGHANALGSGTYTIGGASASFDNSSGGSLTIGNAFTMSGGSPTFVGSNPLTISGAVTLSGANRTITVSASTLTLSGNISESGSRTLTKAGSGTLTLSGNNSHSGGTTLSAGTLNIGHANALGSGTFSTGAGTFDNSSGGALTVANAVTFDGNPTFTGTQPLTISGAGQLNGAATRTITVSASTLTLSGALGEDAAGRNLTKAGSGTLVLSGNNTYSGNSTVSAGTLQIGAGGTSGSVAGNIANNAALIFDRSDDLTYSGVISGSGTLEKKSAGTLTLSGNNTFSGAATISGGTIKMGHANALGSTGGGTTVAAGGALDLNGQTVGGEAVTLNGHGINGGGALINSSGTASLSGTIALNSASAIGGANQMTLSGVISGANQLTKVGAGTTILSGNNSFSGNSIISNGLVRLTHANGLGSTAGSNIVMSGAAVEVSGVNSPEPMSINGTGISGGGALRSASGSGTFSGGIALGSDSSVGVDADTLTISGIISGGFALTKVGAGALAVGVANTFSGGLRVNEGILRSTANASSLGAGTVTIGAASGSANANLEFTGAARTHANDVVIASGSSGAATITNAGNVSITLSGGFTVNKAVSLSPVGGASSVININGAMSGSANVDVNAGAGNYVSFGGNNSSFSGTVNVNNGTARLSAANSMSSAGSVMVGASGTLDVRVGVTVGYLTGSGTVLNNSGSGSTLTLSPSSGTTTFGGSLQNGFSTLTLIKSGSGTQVLTGASTYSGNTTVSGGTLVMNGTNTSTAVTVASGATLMGSGAVGGLTVQNGGTVRPGSSASAIGSLAVSSLTMNNGSSARFKIGDASDTSKRDFIANSGSATISATTTIYLDDSQLSNFNPSLSYSWNLIVGGISSAANFSLNDTTYWSTSKAGGTFSLSASGSNLVLTFTPVAGEPTTQATSIGFSAIGTNAMTVSWTSGDGANRVVVAHAGAAVDANPSDNTTYTANATFGSGTQIGTGNYVVYNGTGSSMTVTGLSANVVYYFRVYEYNGTAGSEDYLTSTATGNPASQTTLAVEPGTQASTITTTVLGDTSLTFAWTSGNGANRLVIVRQGSAPSGGPADGASYTADSNFSGSGSSLGGGKVVYQGSGSSVAVSGLSASTLYYVQVFEYNGSGASLNYNVNTASGNPGNRYSLATEPSSHATAFSATAASASQINLSWTAAGGPPSGYIILQRSGAAPTGTPSDGQGYTVGNTIGDATVAAIVTPGSSTSANITGLSAGTQYYFTIIPFNWDGSHAQTYNYRTVATIPSANATTYAAEPATQASSIALSSRTKSSLSISWTSGDGANRMVLVREAAAVNSDPVDATAYTANAAFGSGSQIGTGNYVVYGGSGSSVTITGLKTNTAYYIRVYEYNGSGGTLNYLTSTATGNPNNFTTQDNEPGIGVSSPILLSTTVGVNPADEPFVVTNIGGSALSYSVSDDATWFSVSPSSASGKTAGQTQSHTITFNVTGLKAGVSNATITVTNTGSGDNLATNSPQTITLTLTLAPLPEPTAVSVTPDAPEFNRLTWTKNPSYDVMIVHRAGGVPAVPVSGTSYSPGSVVSGDTYVIYKGSGAALEHVVAAGSENQYVFYTTIHDHYSDGVTNVVQNPSYTPNVAVEQFSYTNGLSLNGLNGGQNWSTVWSVGSGSFAVSTQKFVQATGYPTMGGNVIVGTNSQASRDITNVNSGKLYVAFKFRNDGGNNTQWSGFSFFNGGTELKFVGESYAGDRNFTVGSTSRGVGSLAANTDYTIIVMHDFSANTTYGNIYTNGVESVPGSEPGTWQVTDSGSMAQVNRIRVGGNVGMRWDEIRIATNWSSLLVITPTAPYATNYVIGSATNYATDGGIKAGSFPVMMAFRVSSGVESTNTLSPFFQPNFDLMNPGGTQILTDKVFATFAYQDGGKTLIASNNTHSTVDRSAVTLGVYTARWSAISSNGFSTIDSVSLSNGAPIQFTVVDDDDLPPSPVNINSTNVGGGSARLLHIALDGTNVSANGASSNSIMYTTTDASLTNLSSAWPLTFWLGGRDPSGVSRGNTNAAENSSLSIGSAIVSNVLQWDVTRSSSFADTANATATNVWSWITPFSNAELENLVVTSTTNGSNAVVITWIDADDDRAGDKTSMVYTQGWFKVTDDDTTPPTLQNFRIWGAEGTATVRVDELTSGTGWGITGRVSDAGSGVNVNGAGTTQPDNSPYFELWDPTGVMRFRHAFDTLGFADGGATTLSSMGNGAATVSGVTFADVGVWTARVIVADNDEDYGVNDHAIATNELPFSVVMGATLGGIARSPSNFAVTSYYGSVTSTNPWPQFFVTNIGSGTLNYNATVSYSGPGGWLSVTPSSGSLTGTGVWRGHTNSIDASGLGPGAYSATITLSGDQTNAAQTIAVNLRVFGYYPGEIVDQFTNTSGSLESMIGGSGWSGAWDNNPDSGYSIDSGSLTVPGNYPVSAGNKACGNTGSGTELQTFRTFGTTFSTGKVFMAVAVRKTDGNSDGYNGVSFTSNGTEVAFAGKLFNSEKFGLDLAGNGSAAASDFGVNGTGDPGYFYIGMYDFSANKFYGRAYNNSDSLPLTEPSWGVTTTPTTAIGSINGIRFGAKSENTVCFDELRVASSWEGLLNLFANEPNVHASGMNFRDVQTNAMVVGWTSGNGGNRIVIAREGSAVTFSPTDSVTYAFNNDFTLAPSLGDGNKLVYNGGGTNFTLTGLNPETRYFFSIYEYNGATANYYTNAGYATGSRWTLSPESANPIITFNAYPASDTTMTNAWSLPGGSPAPDGYLILRRQGSAVDQVPVDGVGYTNDQVLPNARVAIVTPGTATSFLQSNLASCVSYHFKIFPFRWNGASAETYNYLTNSAATANAETLCEAPLAQASNIAFSVTDTNLITVSWQRGNGQGNVLVVRGTNSVSALPLDGTTYTGNLAYGSGTHLGDGNYVMYVGTGSTVTITGLRPATVYHFRVFEYNGAGAGIDYNTNTATDNPKSTTTASFGLVEDKFIWNYWGNYANNNLSGAGTGTGWTNSWSTYGGYVAVDDANSPAFKGYPADPRSGCGNNCDDSRQVKISTVSGSDYGATRNFPQRSSGKLYVAIKINIQDTSQTNSWAGLSLYSGGTEVAYLGKGWGNTTELTLNDNNSHSVTNSTFNNQSTWRLYGGAPYLLVLQYDFDNKVLRGAGMTTNMIPAAIPEAELAWNVEITNVNISAIDGIRMAGRNVGDLIFDHIRIGPSWENVIWDLPTGWHENNGPVPTLVYIGTNYGPSFYSQVITNLSDAELKSSQLIDFAVRWDSPTYGVFLTNNVATNRNQGSSNARVSPNWDPLSVGVASNLYNMDQYFTNFFGYNGSTVVTTYQKNGFSVTNINFEEQYFVTVSAETDPGGSTIAPPLGATWNNVPATRALTINKPLRFYVYDDDTNAPTLGVRPLRVYTNTTLAGAQAVGNLERYFVYDGMLTQAGMRVQLNAYDSYSGIQRSSSGLADTNFSITIPYVATNNVANYDASLSSTNTKVATATSTWTFASSLFNWQSVSDMWGGDGKDPQGQDVQVLANIPDADDDRVDDQAWASNAVMGYIRLLDDDTIPPEAFKLDFAGQSPRPFSVNTNGVAIGGAGEPGIRGVYQRRTGTGSNVTYAVTDEEMAKSGSRQLQFVFGAMDTNSGVRRGTTGTTNSIMTFSFGDILVGVTNGWNPTLSTSVNAPGVPQTNIWTYGNGDFSVSLIDQLMGATGETGTGSVPVYVMIPDSDDDRTNDASTLYSSRVGYLQVLDDDVDAFPVQNLMFRSNLAVLAATGFENAEGWTNFNTYTTQSLTTASGIWTLHNMIANTLQDRFAKRSQTRKLQFNDDPPKAYLQFPTNDDVGTVFAWMRSSSGTATNRFIVEYNTNGVWIGTGYTNLVIGTNYALFSWNVDVPGTSVSVRLVADDVKSTTVFIDDVSLTRYMAWTNGQGGSNFTLSWNNPTSDMSGIYQYWYTNAAVAVPDVASNGVLAATNSVTFSSTAEGVLTGFVYMVDNDDDRTGDRTKGMSVPYVSRIDLTPPPRVTGLSGTNGYDDTSEIALNWSGPCANAGDHGTPLSPWYSYIVYYTEQPTGPTTNSSYFTYDSPGGPASLATNITSAVTLSNFLSGVDYRLAIAGVDRAGNIGPLSDTVVVSVANFVVTQGLVSATSKKQVEVSWIAKTNAQGDFTRVFDVIYFDARNGFANNTTNQWAFMSKVTNSWGYDTGSVTRTPPYSLTSTLRFYRAAIEDQWRTNQAIRRASEQIYVTKSLSLVPGQNWYSLFAVPDSNSIARVFGTNRLPASGTISNATRITWYSGGTATGAPTKAVYLSASNRWIYSLGGVGIADHMPVPLGEGFDIELPGSAPAQNFILVGQLPTNASVQTVYGGTNFNVLSYSLPRRVRVKELQLRDMGFRAGTNVIDMVTRGSADELRVLNNATGNGTMTSPRLTIWFQKIGSSTGNFMTVAGGNANDLMIEPEEAIIWLRRGSGTTTWTNDPALFYNNPTKTMMP